MESWRGKILTPSTRFCTRWGWNTVHGTSEWKIYDAGYSHYQLRVNGTIVGVGTKIIF